MDRKQRLTPSAIGVVLALKSQTPFPIAPCLIASRSYNVRGILIALANMVADTPFLEQVCKRFLDRLPAVNRSRVIHKNRVLREKRGHGSGIVVVACLVKFLTLRVKLHHRRSGAQ